MVVNYANPPRIENQDSENCDHNATYGATLTWHGFRNAIRGDGNRLLRYWKVVRSLQVNKPLQLH